MKHWLLLMVVCSANPAAAAFDYAANSAFSASLQSSFTAYSSHPAAFLINPALMKKAGNAALSINYCQPWGISQLQYGSLAAVLPLGQFGSALMIERMGHTRYQESRIMPALSWHQLSSGLSLGISIPVYIVSADRYSASNAVGINVGFSWRISESLNIGGSAENFNRPLLAGSVEELPQHLRFGLAWFANDDLTTFINVQKDAWFDPEVVFGVDYTPTSAFTITSSYSSAGEMPAAGIRTGIGHWRVEYAWQYHLELGASHVFGLSWQ